MANYTLDQDRRLLIGPRRYSDFLNTLVEFRSNTAILSPDTTPLRYDDLIRQIESVSLFLNNNGFGINDRIGVIMPDSPEMVVLFLGIIAGSTFVPLSRHHSIEEYEFLISTINIKCLVVQHGFGSNVIPIAKKFGLPVIEVKRKSPMEVILEFDFQLMPRGRPENTDHAEPDDIAMVLTTSGTTSRPKLVPITYAGILYSAGHVADALGLSTSDRSLHILSMVHIAGLLSGIISPLMTGGSIVCTPGFSDESFFGWLHEFQPTWYYCCPHHASNGD